MGPLCRQPRTTGSNHRSRWCPKAEAATTDRRVFSAAAAKAGVQTGKMTSSQSLNDGGRRPCLVRKQMGLVRKMARSNGSRRKSGGSSSACMDGRSAGRAARSAGRRGASHSWAIDGSAAMLTCDLRRPDAQLLDGKAHGVERRGEGRHRRAAGLRQMQPLRMADKKRRAQPCLERLDLMRYGRRRDAEFVRSLGEALMTSSRLKGPQSVERRHSRSRRIDGHRPASRTRRRPVPQTPMQGPFEGHFYLRATGVSLPSTSRHSNTTKPGCLISPLPS